MSELNRTLLREVADLIEREDRFDLNIYAGVRAGYTDCDATYYGDEVDTRKLIANTGEPRDESTVDRSSCMTVGCVAGWTNAAIGNRNASDWHDAALALGIDPQAAYKLFHAEGGSVWARLAAEFGWQVYDATDDEFPGLVGWEQITAVEAAKVLRMVADGEIDLEGAA